MLTSYPNILGCMCRRHRTDTGGVYIYVYGCVELISLYVHTIEDE